MRPSREQQSLSYPLRLPDAFQADALRLLEVSREAINLTVMVLWDRLDEFATRTNRYAYKQVAELMSAPLAHGHRQWRCEAEQAGRILRGQAERKQLFAHILPVLAEGMIQPRTEKRPAGKSRKAIKQALADLRDADSDGGSAAELRGLIEQACNFYLQNGCFPATYEEMQPPPVLKAGILPYAADDGAEMGQTYRLTVDLDQKQLTLALRTPDESDYWTRTWREKTCQIQIPDVLFPRLQAGEMQAPSLREIQEPDGARYAVLDFMVGVVVEPPQEWEDCQNVLGFDRGIRVLVTASVVNLGGNQVGYPFFLDIGPFDGRQARLRRQIDLLKARIAALGQQRDRFPLGDPRRQPAEDALPVLRLEVSRCWRKYEARNNDLAHLAAGGEHPAGLGDGLRLPRHRRRMPENHEIDGPRARHAGALAQLEK